MSVIVDRTVSLPLCSRTIPSKARPTCVAWKIHDCDERESAPLSLIHNRLGPSPSIWVEVDMARNGKLKKMFPFPMTAAETEVECEGEWATGNTTAFSNGTPRSRSSCVLHFITEIAESECGRCLRPYLKDDRGRGGRKVGHLITERIRLTQLVKGL